MKRQNLQRQLQVILLGTIFSVGLAQAQDTIRNGYALAVKQEFKAWGDCKSDPDFGDATIGFLTADNKKLLDAVFIEKNGLKDLIILDEGFRNTEDEKDNLALYTNEETLDSIGVETYAGDIKNDHHLTYSFIASGLRVGFNKQSREASDPCNNTVSFKREGYTMTTTVIVDDPVFVYNHRDTPLKVEEDTLVLDIGSYFLMDGADRPVLQYTLQSAPNAWKNMKAPIVSPNSEIRLSYEDIAGRKGEPGSNYFKWMGKRIDFRVVKKLMNGTVTYGNIATGAVFYPQGLQYKVLDVTRNNCEDGVEVKVKLDKSGDAAFFEGGIGDCYWILFKGSGTSSVSEGIKCSMKKVKGEELTYIIEPKDDDENPANSFDQEEGLVWKLQLQVTDITDAFACVREFYIPPRPEPIKVNEKAPEKLLGGKKYDLLDAGNPYGIIEIEDVGARYPYTIVNKASHETLKVINEVPASYNNLTKAQKDSLGHIFEDDFEKMVKEETNPYRTYFDVRLKKLWNSYDNTAPEKAQLNALVNSEMSTILSSGTNNEYRTYFNNELDKWWPSNKNGVDLGISGASNLLFADDGSFFVYLKNDIIYKATINNSNNTCSSTAKSAAIPNKGIQLWDISPDGKTLIFVYKIMSHSSPRLYKLSLTGSGTNTPVDFGFHTNLRTNSYAEDIFWNGGDDGSSHIVAVKKETGVVSVNIKNRKQEVLMANVSTSLSDVIKGMHEFKVDFCFYDYGWSYQTTSGDITSLFSSGSNVFIGEKTEERYQTVVSDYKGSRYIDCFIDATSGDTYQITSHPIEPGRAIFTTDNKCVYYYNSSDANKKGMYRTSLDKDDPIKLNSVNADYMVYSPDKNYMLYVDKENETNKVFKHYIDKENAATILYPNKEKAVDWYNAFRKSDIMYQKIHDKLWANKNIASTWYEEFKADYKKDWLHKRFGIKVSKGVEINKKINCMLIDKDGCEYDFPIEVTAPTQPQIHVAPFKNPTNYCTRDGIVKVTYSGGGYPPYSYSGDEKLSNTNKTITINGLGINDDIYLEYVVGDEVNYITRDNKLTTSTGGLLLTPGHQTCAGENGEIKVTVAGFSGSKTYYLLEAHSEKITGSKTTGLNEYTFTDVPPGEYAVEVLSATNSACGMPRQQTEVKSLIFDMEGPITTNATTIGEEGKVILNFENRDEAVSWATAPDVFNLTENKDVAEYDLLPGEYTITAEHKGCRVTKDFTIEGPAFEAEVGLQQTDDELQFTAIMDNALYMSPYHFELSDGTGTIKAESNDGENLAYSILTPGDYYLKLVYSDDAKSFDVYNFSYPLGDISATTNVTAPACPGAGGSITITPSGGIDGTGFLFNAVGTTYQTENSFPVKAGQLDYKIKDESSEARNGDGYKVRINQALVKTFTEQITAPAPVTGIVDAVDVSCHGLNNGQVSVFNLKGGSGKYQYRVGEGHWHDTAQAITGLSPGVRPVFLRDSENGCAQREVCTILIEQPDTLKIDTFNILHPTCELENGALYTEVEGGNGHYRHDWQYDGSPFYTNGTLGPDSITVFGDTLRFGLYTLQLTDNKGCQLAQSFRLEEYFNPQIDSVQISDVLCHGDTNGAIKIMEVSGTAPMEKLVLEGLGFQHNDTIENIGNSFKKLRYGQYEIHAFDTLGCQSGAPYKLVVNQPDTSIYIVVDTIAPVLTKGSSTGRIRSTIYGGNLELKKTVLTDKTGAVTSTRNERSEFPILHDTLKAGSYTISVADSKGCSFITDTLKVIEPEKALSFTVTEKHDALCKAQTGSITVEAEGGWGGYTYKKATDKGHYPGNTFENLYAGHYQITVRDKYGATYTEAITVHEPKDSLQAIITAEQAPTCNNNGSLQVGVKGGTAPYKLYFEDENDTTEASLPQTVTLNNRPEGGHMLHVNDSNGCRFQLGTNLGGTELLNINNIVLGFPTTTGANDGYLETQITGGKAPITHLWKELNGSTFAETGPRLGNIPSGHYEVTVTENGGCGQTKRVYLPEINERSLIVVDLGHETAYGAQNGHATLYACTGDITEIEVLDPDDVVKTYSITDSSGGFYFSNDTIYLKNLKGGDYFVSATNSNKKSAYTEFTIEAYHPMEITEETITHARRIGETNGEVSVVVAGGAGDYVFQWTNTANPVETLNTTSGETTSTLANAKAGAYEFKVTDKFGNELTKEYGVLEPGSPLKISIAEYRNESCKGYEDAYVTAQAEGGWGGYQFRWDSSGHYSNGYTWLNLKVRGHYFYLTDKMGVKDSMLVDITEPGYLTSSMGLIDSVNCKGAPDGDFNFNINGGTEPYYYAVLTTPGLWTEDTVARGFAEGTYTFVFTDSNNCTGQDTLTAYMPEPDSLLFKEIDIAHTTCDMDNGTITVAMQGGTRPYRYEWSDFDKNPIGSDSVINGLERSGYYFLDVYDMHGCPQHFGQFIKPSTNPVITDVDTTPLFCYGDSTGTAQVVSETAGVPYARTILHGQMPIREGMPVVMPRGYTRWPLPIPTVVQQRHISKSPRRIRYGYS